MSDSDSTTELIEFLRARHAEDMRAAGRACTTRIRQALLRGSSSCQAGDLLFAGVKHAAGSAEQIAHVLGRLHQIVSSCEHALTVDVDCELAFTVLSRLAVPYSHHLDYRTAWAPQAAEPTTAT